MAQSVIGALRVNLGLDSAQFEKGAGRVRNGLGRLRADFARIARAGAAFGAAMGVVGGTAVRAAREVERLSQVSNTAPEQFQRMAAASETVGIQQDKLADIFKDTTDRVGDFLTTGGGPMADFFENIAPKVGVTADQFARLSGPEALQLYVKSLEDAGASQAEMTFYLEAIASDATLLLPLLRDNGAEMARLGQRAAELGGVMNSETVAALARARTAFGEIATAMTGARNIIAAELAPSLERLATTLVNALLPGGELRFLFVGLVGVGRVLANVIDLVSENLSFLIDLFKVFVAAKIVVFLGSVMSAMIALARAIRATGLIMVAFNGIMSAKITAALFAVAAIGKLTGTYESMSAWVKRTGAELTKMLPESLRSNLENLGHTLRDVTGINEAATKGAEALQGALQGSAVAAGSFGEAARGASKGVEAVAKTTETARANARSFGQTFGSEVSSAFQGVKTLSEGVGRLASRLRDMALDSAITNLFGALGGTGLGQSLAGSLGGVFGGGAAPSFAGGGYTGIGSRSGGLDGMGGFPAILHPNETVIDHTRGGNMPAPVVNIINPPSQPTVTQGPNGRIDVTFDQMTAATIRSGPQTRAALAQGYGLKGLAR